MIDIARVRSPARDEAKKLYLESNGEIKLVDIAAKLNVLDSQVRKWKSQDKWEHELKGALPKVKRSVTNKKETKCNKAQIEKETIEDEVEEIINNSALTDKQRLFCIYFIKCFNATKAYQKAYKCSYNVANTEGSKLLVKPSIKEEIERLKKNKLNQIYLTEFDIFQRYLDIAFSNLGDYLTINKKIEKVWEKDRNGEYIPVIDPNTGEQKVIIFNEILLNDSEEVDTTLLSEVKQGKDGISIKLHDSMKALDWLSKHMNIATEEQKLKVERLKLEISKLKGDDIDIEDTTEIESEIYDN